MHSQCVCMYVYAPDQGATYSKLFSSRPAPAAVAAAKSGLRGSQKLQLGKTFALRSFVLIILNPAHFLPTAAALVQKAIVCSNREHTIQPASQPASELAPTQWLLWNGKSASDILCINLLQNWFMMMELEHNQAKAAASKCIQRKVWDCRSGGGSATYLQPKSSRRRPLTVLLLLHHSAHRSLRVASKKGAAAGADCTRRHTQSNSGNSSI